MMKLQCQDCGAVVWVRGNIEYDTNALNLDDNDEDENPWTCGKWPECEHENFEVVDFDDEPRFLDDV